jgi:hypothetical protein F3_00972
MEFFEDLFEKNNPELSRPNLFERCKMSDEKNPNAFHFWFDGMNKTLISKEFKISESVNLFLPQDMLESLMRDGRLTREEEKSINDFFHKENSIGYPVFIKNGLFSNKFEFNNCIVTHPCQFAKKLHNIYYAGMCNDVDFTREVVLRKPIPVSTDFSIYQNMPLGLEFRCFVDLDKKEVVDVIDYWHSSIKNRLPEHQRAVFDIAKQDLTKQFEERKDEVWEKVRRIVEAGAFNNLKEGRGDNKYWSLDIMSDYYDELWLIDMAIAKQSWGVHLLDDDKAKRLGLEA